MAAVICGAGSSVPGLTNSTASIAPRPRTSPTDGCAAASPVVGDVRGRGAMCAAELVKPGTMEPDPAAAARVAKTCHANGTIVLTCGTYGNVLRLLPPLVMGESLLTEGMSILADAFATL